MSFDGTADYSATGGEYPSEGGTVSEEAVDGATAGEGTDAEPGGDVPPEESARAADPEREPSDPLSRDDVFDVLSNQRRRHLLHYLKQRDGDGEIELSEISSQLAAWEQGTAPEMISYADRKNVHTALYQFHLPKMADAGFVDYDQRSGSVRLTEAARGLEVYLETGSDRDVPWGMYFLGLSCVTTAVALATWLQLGPTASLPVGVPAMFVAVAFLASSVAFAYRTHFVMRIGAEGPPTDVE
ncbi:hypothetical protein ACFQE1_13045 [Halobium palmae]|uniref:DUF7344 domain-containing protein n=1 Tax=Halobium palmae TaxID=1776492 RepID=A0ABD5S0S4_9EURY